MDKKKASLRSINFEISPPNAEGLVTLSAIARIGDGAVGENMGQEYQCHPAQIPQILRIATAQLLDLADDFVNFETRIVCCQSCNDQSPKGWSEIVTPEDACPKCGAVGTATTEPRFVTQQRRLANPRLHTTPTPATSGKN